MISFITYTLFSSNKLYDATSYEYRLTEQLCNIAGKTGPSSATPVTASELTIALDRISTSDLPTALHDEFDDLRSRLYNQDTFKMQVDLSVSPQLFFSDTLSKGKDTGLSRNDFYIPYNREAAGIAINVNAEFGNTAYLETAYDFKNMALSNIIPITSFDWLSFYIPVETNYPVYTNCMHEVPLLARGAIGNKWMNLVAGRTPHSMGTGFTGNLNISDNFDYQELLKTSFTSRYFTFNNSITHFDTQTGLTEFLPTSFGEKHQIRVVNRLDFNIIDRIRVVANLSTSYFSDSAFDFRWMTPLMFAHNYYNYSENPNLNENTADEANNLMVFELDYNFLPGWKLGFQFALDQMQAKIFKENEDSLPAAWGTLLNLSWDGYTNGLLIKAYAEGAYTNPFLYLNHKYDVVVDQPATYDSEGNLVSKETYKNIPNYNYDYIYGYKRKGSVDEISYSGYPYGPDTIAFNVGTDITDIKRNLSYNVDFLYKVHGIKGILSPDFQYKETATTPSGDNPEHLIRLSGDVRWTTCNDTLDVFGGIGLSYFINHRHTTSNRFMPQAIVGITWRPLANLSIEY